MNRKLLFLIVLLVSSTMAWADDSGSCGDGVTYTYVESSHILNISGTGAMADYTASTTPWNAYRSQIESVVIGNGITRIGDYAFYGCYNLASVYVLATTPPDLGENVFFGNASGRKFFVPNVATYTGATGWSDYSSDFKVLPLINAERIGASSAPVMYKLTDASSIDASVVYAINALNDQNAVFYDASSLNNEITLNPVNPNAMISAKPDIVIRENNANIIVNNECSNLMLVDKKPFHLPNTLTLGNPARLTMWMSSAGMATIVLPFDAYIPAGISAYKVVRVEGDGGEREVLTNQCERIKKNEPVLIVGGEGEYMFFGYQEDTELPATTGDLTCGLLVGTYIDIEVPNDSYLLQNHSGEVGFYHVNNDINSYGLKPFHAYLNAPSTSARSINIIFDDSATAITTVKPVSDAPKSAFNFLGQEVKPNTKGFVIVNGIKMYNK